MSNSNALTQYLMRAYNIEGKHGRKFGSRTAFCDCFEIFKKYYTSIDQGVHELDLVLLFKQSRKL